MSKGLPWRHTISLTYIFANLSTEYFSRMGKKWADLVKRSTITQILSKPLGVRGSLVMKSIAMLSHFHTRISGCSSIPDGRWCSALTFEQVRHFAMKRAISFFIPGHQ